MPFLTPAIGLVMGAGISAGASIYGAKKQGSANDKAIAAQTAATDKALAFEKEKLAGLNTRMAPYVQAGAGATRRMSDLLHLSPNGVTAQQGAPGATRSMASYAGPTAPAGGGAPVTLRSPDGATRQFTDPAMIDHYLKLGAQRVA